MSLETVTTISTLNPANPTHDDSIGEADAHVRNIKQALLTTFPGITTPVTLTSAVLNSLPTAVILAIAQAATNANASLGVAMGAEASSRAAADIVEANARAASVASLSAGLNGVSQDRYNADVDLYSRINSEANARSAQDVAIINSLAGYAPNGAFSFYETGGGYYRINLAGGIQIALGYAIGVTHGSAVSYQCNFSNVATILISDQSNNGMKVGAWKRDSNSMLTWVRDNAGNPASTNVNFIVVGTA